MARRIRDVKAAIKASVARGSSQSAFDGTAIRPSGEYGYGESGLSIITMCSPDHSVENPTASAVAATALITVGSAPDPMPRAWSPHSHPLIIAPLTFGSKPSPTRRAISGRFDVRIEVEDVVRVEGSFDLLQACVLGP